MVARMASKNRTSLGPATSYGKVGVKSVIIGAVEVVDMDEGSSGQLLLLLLCAFLGAFAIIFVSLRRVREMRLAL
jgi:hypothetical protein